MKIRKARAEDLPALAALLADDPLGASRESADSGAYEAAFQDIDADPNQFLAVAEMGGAIVGTLQLTFIPGLSRGGMLRAQIEAVRVASGQRSAGLGEKLFEWAADEARRRGAGLLQLTTDKSRPDAHRFYDRLGFEASHIGYKRKI